MTPEQALTVISEMVARKVAIYDGIADKKQRAALLREVKALSWAGLEAVAHSGGKRKNEQLHHTPAAKGIFAVVKRFKP